MVTLTPAKRAEFAFLSLSALLLPTLSLLPLGGWLLWEKGWLLQWAIASLAVVAIVFFIQRVSLRVAAKPTSSHSSNMGTSADETEAALSARPASIPEYWSTAERLAWADVRKIAATVDVNAVSNQDQAWLLAVRTTEAVAKRLNPGHPNAVWSFTVPEALAIGERVSRRLASFVATHVPFGDRLTVSQMLNIYRARTIADFAGKAYDIWRILRLANPATAVTHEVRERVTKALISWGREHASKRLLEAYIEEIGRAAIDLYSGRLHPASASLDVNEAVGGQISGTQETAATKRIGVHRQVANSLRAMVRRR